MNTKTNQDKLREQIEEILDKHTKHLTKTTGFDGKDIISFDTVVMDAYEAKGELLALFNQEYKEREKKTYEAGRARGYVEAHEDLVKVRQKVKKKLQALEKDTKI